MALRFTNSAITDFLELIGLSAATPDVDRLRLFVKKIAGQTFLAYKDEKAFETVLMPHAAYHKYGYWSSQGNSNLNPVPVGMASFTTVGTLTSRVPAITNIVTRRRRVGLLTVATAGLLASFYQAVAQFFMSNGAGLGGFHVVFKFNVADPANVAAARMFIGVRNIITAPTNVEPSILTNSIGLAKLAASSNLQIVYGGSTAQAAIDLGVDFPANDPAAAYTLTLRNSATSVNSVFYEVKREGTEFSASGLLTGAAGVALPLNSLALGLAMWRTNNATASIVGLDIESVFLGGGS